LYNDADIAPSFMDEVLGILKAGYENYELVLVDDGSTDATVEKVSATLDRHECVRLLRLSRRFGRDTAISAGLDSVIGDFVVVMMPESDPPTMIPELVERCRAGVGVVYGVRKDRKGEPMLMRSGVDAFYWYFNRVLKINLPKNSTEFRVYSRQAVNAITRIKDRLRYLRTFPDYVGYGNEGFTYTSIQRRPQPRVRGLLESFKLAVNMVVANSTHPLRVVSGLGLALSTLSLLYSLYVVLVYLLVDNVVAGWATRSLQTSVMFVFLFLILAVLCEYVGRLLDEVKDRPPYYILEERNSSVLIADETRKNVVTESEERG
jgi:dolichol-phosphate mannosyltransferase